MTRIVLDIDAVRFNHLGPVSKPDHLREIAERFEGNTLPGSNACATAADILDLVAEQLEHPSPLIVIEAVDDNHFPSLVAYLRKGGWDLTAAQIEAQTKPARIPEPMRWGSKVRTARATYVLLDIATLGRRWLDEHDGQLYKWDALIDPTLIREGVES